MTIEKKGPGAWLNYEDTDSKRITVVSVIGHSGALDPLPLGSDFGLDAARGAVSGRAVVQKFGRNPVVGTTTEAIWTIGGAYTGFLQAAVACRVAAGGHANDAAGGSGVTSVTIVGLDENWLDASETVATAGANASAATTTTFIRVFRAYCAGVGTYGGVNAGAVTIETTGGVSMAGFVAGKGQSEMAIAAVPAGKTAYLTRMMIVIGSTNKEVDVSFVKREGGDVTSAPFGCTRTQQFFGALVSGVQWDFQFRSFPSFPAKSDMWVQAVVDTGDASVEASFDYYLVDD